MDPQQGDDKSHVPAPSLLPVVFAIGVVVLLVGLIINNWIAVGIGAVIAIAFGGVWLRDITTSRADEGAPPPPPSRPVGASVSAATTATIEEGERYPRDRFLEGATLGLGAVIGAVVTIPSLGLLTASSFEGQSFHKVDLGPISDFPVGKFLITTFVEDPAAGEVSRRTAYIRNNGFLDKLPSFTILSNRCAHLGCPVQPNGPVENNQTKQVKDKQGNVVVQTTPVQPAGFGCPCHGGQYDTEGNRTAGPPVRALDRYAYSIVQGRLVLGSAYSVAKVKGTGKDAQIKKSSLHNPGQHVDGWEFWLWPIPEIRT
ncbi:MAG: ubiquinol-cytochrome c reductase iron-sulfur subunit [Verrucomicrobiota bacterium]